jgi:hypothetical protein
MRGSLTFKILPDQSIQCDADLYELTEFDLFRVATALTEQAFKLELSAIAKVVEKSKQVKLIQDASAEVFKRKVDENSH